jgi:EpsD family peptidyl-prolyl cis-trans isomerase
MFRSGFALALGVLSVLPMLTACGQPSIEGDATQVIARVDNAEISMWQYNHALQRAGVTLPSVAVKKELAAKLVDRELALQAALAAKMDRQPDVMLQLEEARRDVLARAWAEHTARDASQPTDNIAARYFKDHPELFAERRIYRLREAALPADLKQLDEVKSRLVAGLSMDQVTTWLRGQQVSFNEQRVIRAAEQLPIEALPRLQAASAGQVVFFETPRGVLLYQVLGVESAPVSWENARPIIFDYLRRQGGKRAVQNESDRLRQAARIQYLGEFAELFAEPPAKGAP